MKIEKSKTKIVKTVKIVKTSNLKIKNREKQIKPKMIKGNIKKLITENRENQKS